MRILNVEVAGDPIELLRTAGQTCTGGTATTRATKRLRVRLRLALTTRVEAFIVIASVLL